MAHELILKPAARFTGLLVVLVAAVLVASCESGTSRGTARDGRGVSSQGGLGLARAAGPVKVTATPTDNSVNVPLDAPVRVTAAAGTLTSVNVTTGGSRLDGGLSEGRDSWLSSGSLQPDAVYRVEARAINADGESSEIVQTFSTVKPTKVLTAHITPKEGDRVGVGMPITVTFNAAVKNKADVEKRLRVESSKPVQGAWRWFGDQEVHYRPKAYWPAQTNITVRANLRGVGSGTGSWGARNGVQRFAIVKAVVTKVDLTKYQAQVYIDGKLARTIPVTGGKPGWETRNGTKVILEKRENIVFTNEAIGAPEDYELTSRWGLRVTWSGEFLHTASWSTGSQGSSNVSHGCIGLNSENSGWLWSVSNVGDPVEFDSPNGDQMDISGNGYGDWNLSWPVWKAGSALS